MNTRVRILSECSIMVALATVLSLFKLLDLPHGGSVTLASMFPILLIAYRHGTLWGLSTAAVYGCVQLLLGLNSVSYFTTPLSIIAVILLDYILAFAVLGLGGIFRRFFARQDIALLCGAALACLLRYILHVIAGATVWPGLSIPDNAALLYSLGYNATYMVPETLILLLVTAYLSSLIDFRRRVPTRMPSVALGKPAAACLLGAGAACILALGYAVIEIFAHLQNADSGDFDITGLSAVNWTLLGIVAAVAALLVAGLLLLARHFLRSRTHASAESNASVH